MVKKAQPGSFPTWQVALRHRDHRKRRAAVRFTSVADITSLPLGTCARCARDVTAPHNLRSSELFRSGKTEMSLSNRDLQDVM